MRPTRPNLRPGGTNPDACPGSSEPRAAILHIQCRHGDEVGTFLRTAEGVLVSPVFADSTGLYQWAKANGWRGADGKRLTFDYVRDVAPTSDVESEVTRRKAQGLYPLTVAAMSARFRALGYWLDRSMDCAGVARMSSGDSYPVVTTGLKEADTGLSAFNVGARRDDAFRAMQALRQEAYAVVNGRILEV